jgi:hypothetical protein
VESLVNYLTPENFIFLIAFALFARAIWFLLNAGNKNGVETAEAPVEVEYDPLPIKFKTSLDQTPGSVEDFCRSSLPDIDDKIHFRQMRTYFKYQYSLILALIMLCIGVSIPQIMPFITVLITKIFSGG